MAIAAWLEAGMLTPFLTVSELPFWRGVATVLQDYQFAPGQFSGLFDAVSWNWGRMLIAAAAIVGAVVLSLPLAFTYLRTRPAHEFDSSVLFSIVFLAATIAGILVVVQGSVARALSLAGVVSAVRFRSSLKDPNDAVYILGAIAVGLAAGSNALDIGVVISGLLSVTLVVSWRIRLEVVKREPLPTDHESRHGHRHRDSELTEPTAALTGDGNGAAVSSVLELSPQVPDRVAYIVLETEHSEQTRLIVETFLERETKSWRLEGSSGAGIGNRDRRKHGGGVATLMYLVRFRKHSQPEAVVERLKAVGQSSHFSVHLETGD